MNAAGITFHRGANVPEPCPASGEEIRFGCTHGPLVTCRCGREVRWRPGHIDGRGRVLSVVVREHRGRGEQ